MNQAERARLRREAIRGFGLVRTLREASEDPRTRQIVVAHIGDGVPAVECWALFGDGTESRVFTVAGLLQVCFENGVLVEDAPVSEDSSTDAALEALFGRPVRHLWIGVDD